MRALILALAVAGCATAQGASSNGAGEPLAFTPASVAQGAAVITTEDDFIAAFSPADLSVRLQSPAGGAADQVQALYAGEVRAWSAAERARLSAMVARRQAQLTPLARFLPDEVLFVKTTDRVDGGLPHTRSNAIFWGDTLPENDDDLDRLFFHELFHVLSRFNAARHDELYAMVGFERCAAIDVPPAMRAVMVTNPDAPVVNYVTPAPEGRGFGFLTPVLVADPARWDGATKPNFTDYFDLRFYAFNKDASGRCTTVAGADGAPQVIERNAAVVMIMANAGRNTGYVLHPEELMADNFAQLMMGRTDAPDPQVQQRLGEWLGIR